MCRGRGGAAHVRCSSLLAPLQHAAAQQLTGEAQWQGCCMLHPRASTGSGCGLSMLVSLLSSKDVQARILQTNTSGWQSSQCRTRQVDTKAAQCCASHCVQRAHEKRDCGGLASPFAGALWPFCPVSGLAGPRPGSSCPMWCRLLMMLGHDGGCSAPSCSAYQRWLLLACKSFDASSGRSQLACNDAAAAQWTGKAAQLTQQCAAAQQTAPCACTVAHQLHVGDPVPRELHVPSAI